MDIKIYYTPILIKDNYEMCANKLNEKNCSCTTYDKAKKALKIAEQNGFEDMVEIVQDAIPVDAIIIDGKIIEL